MELWKEVFGLVANVVLLVTAIVAAFGISRWSREHKGRKRIDLAEEVLATAYEAHELIRHLRGPFAWSSESEELQRHDAETDAQFERRKTYSVPYFRYKTHEALFGKLKALCFQVEAIFGKEYGKPIRTILHAPSQVISAGSALARMDPDAAMRRTPEEREAHSQLRRKMDARFSETEDEFDTMTPALRKALQDIEGFCRAVINADGQLPKA